MSIQPDVSDETTVMITPLDIIATKWRYGRLFQVYKKLSDRERGIRKSMGDEIIPKTLCTNISGVDFEEPLAVPDNEFPFPNDSDINKFCAFVWGMFDACDSGSIRVVSLMFTNTNRG